MSLTLYAAVVPPFQKMLGNVRALLDKAEAHCAAQGIANENMLQAHLAPDMLPFAYQVKSTVVHSLGALEGVRKGLFSPDMTPPGETFAALAEKVDDARDVLAGLDPEEINSFEGHPMRFEIKAYHADFLAEGFLLTFSIPNFYFHVATAYDILRMKGVAIGKVDYLGQFPLKK
ncbi:DUF1993 domain-containing protein [Sphingobium aromaticiconvertens]|uniref:DUF1993 domain-containing protein n=1 Tax=Sphingobium aromaticiconvertens TaxID=365341 RepID=UPI00301B66E5